MIALVFEHDGRRVGGVGRLMRWSEADGNDSILLMPIDGSWPDAVNGPGVLDARTILEVREIDGAQRT